MTATLLRRPLTKALLDQLATLNVPIGDMVIPRAGGWSGAVNGPGSTFRPYVVLVTLTASRSSGAFADSQADWQIPYMVESFGASREQCEWMADSARDGLDALSKTRLQLGEDRYKVQQIRVDSIGAVNRVTVTEPAFYGQQDGYSIWLSKERT